MAKKICLAGALLFIPLALLAWNRSAEGPDDAVTQLRKRQQQAQLDRGPMKTDEEKISILMDQLAKAGKVQPLPSDLKADSISDAYWLITRPQQKHGVEIPFPPNRRPRSPQDLESANGELKTTNSAPTTQQAGSATHSFVGPDACAECHRDNHNTFIHTAHYLTSRPASKAGIAGSFEPGKNKLLTSNPNLDFTMVCREDQCAQRVRYYDWHFEFPFDIITGSGKLGQSYLYWDDDKLFQMNVSFISETGHWANSPGFVDGDAAYARPIKRRCLECHTTFAEHREENNQYDPQSIIYGVTCERCHGPGKEHVEFHRSQPATKEAKHIVLPISLTREQQLDICSQCHSGATPGKTEPYQFRPGDRVQDFYHAPPSEQSGTVHTSNQRSRLSLSACFQQSEMTCVTCHDPHQSQRNNAAWFTKQCLQCHQIQHCGFSEKAHPDLLTENCIACHMPKNKSNAIWISTTQGAIFPALQDHFIRADPAIAAEILMRKQKQVKP